MRQLLLSSFVLVMLCGFLLGITFYEKSTFSWGAALLALLLIPAFLVGGVALCVRVYLRHARYGNEPQTALASKSSKTAANSFTG